MDITDALTRLMIGGTAVVTAAAPSFSPDITVPYLGVPLNVIVACAAGAYSSFSFGKKVEPRSAMFKLFFACVFMGCAFTAIANAMVRFWFEGFEITDGVQAGMGAILSCLTRFIIPAIIARIDPWLDKIPFLKKESE